MKRLLKNIGLVALCFAIVAVAALGAGMLRDLHKSSGGPSTAEVNVPMGDDGSAELGIKSFKVVSFPKAYVSSTRAKDPHKYFATVSWRDDQPLSYALDGSVLTVAQSTSIADHVTPIYYPSIYVDDAGLLKVDKIPVDETTPDGTDLSSELGQYIGFFKLSVAKAKSLGSVILWGDGCGVNALEYETFANNSFDVYVSQDGVHWILLNSYTNLCGDGTHAGENAEALFTETGFEDIYENGSVVDSASVYGMRISVEDAPVIPNYVGFAVREGCNNVHRDVVFAEITVEEKAPASAVEIVMP